MKTFQELELIEPVQRSLADEKYKIPTPIQAQTIPAALEGRDILGCAQTGTGKTAAFALPILNRLGQRPRKAKPNHPLVLVLAPTRELAIQIEASFATYGTYLPLRYVLVYGGVKQGNQVRALNRGAHVLVATPGRLLDLMNQKHIYLKQLEVFVLDEADRMLDMGFLPDLKRIISHLPRERQSLFFSATMAPTITQLSKRLLSDPVSVNVTPKTSSVKRIAQRVMFVDKGKKQARLHKIVTGADVDRAIVFTKTKRGANVVVDKLDRVGVAAVAIHGNKSQNARQRALEDFRQRKVTVLVATDVAARGIDIDGVTHVVNFDLPLEPQAYVHRIGRTGRAGAEGIAYSFCSSTERGELRAIEKLIGQKVPLAAGETEPSGSHESGPSRSQRPVKGRRNSRPRRSGGPRADSSRADGQGSAAQEGVRKTAGTKRPNRKKTAAKRQGSRRLEEQQTGAERSDSHRTESDHSKSAATKPQGTKLRRKKFRGSKSKAAGASESGVQGSRDSHSYEANSQGAKAAGKAKPKRRRRRRVKKSGTVAKKST